MPPPPTPRMALTSRPYIFIAIHRHTCTVICCLTTGIYFEKYVQIKIYCSIRSYYWYLPKMPLQGSNERKPRQIKEMQTSTGLLIIASKLNWNNYSKFIYICLMIHHWYKNTCDAYVAVHLEISNFLNKRGLKKIFFPGCTFPQTKKRNLTFEHGNLE